VGEPLASWNERAAKAAVLAFVEREARGWTMVSMKNDWATVFAAGAA